MGVFIIGKDELVEKFEQFLYDVEGEVHATTMAEAWNELAKKNDWPDVLIPINAPPTEEMILLAEQALKSLKERKQENIHEWADRLIRSVEEFGD